MDIDFFGSDTPHLMGERATHPIRPPSGAVHHQLAAEQSLWLCAACKACNAASAPQPSLPAGFAPLAARSP